jgi:flagellar biosynthesis protein FlhF
MGVKRFIADSATEALKLAKSYAGEFGKIISAKQIEGRHEVIAVSSTSEPLDTERLAQELQEVRALVEAHLLANANTERSPPAVTAGLRYLVGVGFSSKLSAELATELPPSDTLSTQNIQTLQNAVAQRLRILSQTSLFREGGAFAFIGPTGVGKTTSIAKIAARCSLEFGRENIALIAMDTYRAGAHDQLKIYAEIIGIPVVVARDQTDLQRKLTDLSSRKIILIDTAGTSHRDIQMLDQLEALNPSSLTLKRILVLSSTSNLHTLEDVIAMHAHALAEQDQRLIAAILTKIDEAAQLAPTLDCLIRHDLPVLWVSQGQRVPEDLTEPDLMQLSYRALHPRPLGEPLGTDDVTITQ